MALTETTEIVEITILPLENNIQAKFVTRYKNNDELLTCKVHYRLYSETDADQFLSDVPGAENYITALGWQ